MSSQLINNLKALLRALVLVLLLGTGLWLMDQIAQTSMAGKSHGMGVRPTSNSAEQSPAPPSAPIDTTARSPVPYPAGVDTLSKAAESGRPPSGAPAKEGATAGSVSPSPQDSRGQQGEALRIQHRPNGQYIATEPILFNTASSTIRPISIEPLKKVAALLAEKPDLKLMIVGYTDNLGLPENNERVSAERAAAVKDFLASQGVDPSRLESKGLGSQNPIASNETQLGRQANRRIEIIVTSPK